MKFTLTIKLGNDAMEELSDLGNALQRLGDELANRAAEVPAGQSGIIRDANGNTVGKWEVSE